MSRVNQAVKSRDSQWNNIYFYGKVYMWTCALFEVHLQPDQMKISPFLMHLKMHSKAKEIKTFTSKNKSSFRNV